MRRGSAAGLSGGAGGRSSRPGTRAGPRSAANGFRGLRAGWRALRVRYSWGGDGEARLRVGARQLSAIGCLPGVPQLQARQPRMEILGLIKGMTPNWHQVGASTVGGAPHMCRRASLNSWLPPLS